MTKNELANLPVALNLDGYTDNLTDTVLELGPRVDDALFVENASYIEAGAAYNAIVARAEAA